MKPIDHFNQFKQWLEKADGHLLDAFASQNEFLIRHLSELWQRFNAKTVQSEKSMPIHIPTETTPIVQTKKVLYLENAKQDEAYFCPQNDDVIIKDVCFSDECGLSWNAEKRALEGIPTMSGEVTISFLLEDGSTSTASLFINPNPKKLWNNIPSDPKVRFWKPDSASGEICTKNGKLIAARQRGRSHAHKGTCCDDDFSMGYHSETGLHFLAVADGAGSAEFSRQGSKVAVEEAKAKVWELLNLPEKSYKDFPTFTTQEKWELITQGLFTNAVHAAFSAQEKTARDANIELKSLSCTLLLAFSLPLNDGRWFTACYWVGDGAVAIFDPHKKEVILLGEVDSGQYSGETQFLTVNEANAEQIPHRIHTHIQDYPPILMLMSDGVSDPKFHTDAKLKTYEMWQQLWNELAEPLSAEQPTVALETWLDFFSKGEHDDRTLAIFIPNGGEIAQLEANPQSETESEMLISETQPDITEKVSEQATQDPLVSLASTEVANNPSDLTACNVSVEASLEVNDPPSKAITVSLVKQSDQGGRDE